jgi:SAM domain (Sterile alpha motif)
MQDLAHWLEELGMAECAQRFAENKVDVSVLRHLTDQDLKGMGVRSAIDERCWRRLRSL